MPVFEIQYNIYLRCRNLASAQKRENQIYALLSLRRSLAGKIVVHTGSLKEAEYDPFTLKETP
jgi:hypothetical protein